VSAPRSLRPPLAPLLGLIASVVLLVLAGDLDRFGRQGQLGPGFWPKVVLVGLSLACLAKLVGDWRARGRESSVAAAAAPPVARGTLGLAILLIVLYVFVTPLLGFPLATAAFIASFMALAGARTAGKIAGGAVIGTIGLLYLFIRVVYLPLPKGDGPFEALTVGLYRALGIF
jgi:putative tricarboxylic transport membrane protein